MQHLGVNFGGIWRFELGLLIWFFCFFHLKNLGCRVAQHCRQP